MLSLFTPLFFSGIFVRIVKNSSWKCSIGKKKNKTGVINDPLGQPKVPAGSDILFDIAVLGRTYGQTTCVNIVITTGLDCGRPRGSKTTFPSRSSCPIDLNVFHVYCTSKYIMQYHKEKRTLHIIRKMCKVVSFMF